MQNNMSMKDAVIAYWTKGFQFSGRARRREYWLNLLATLIIELVIGLLIMIIDVISSYKANLSEHYRFFVTTLFPYINTIPAMAQSSRRLQDININGKVAIVIMSIDVVLSFIFTHVYPILPIDFTDKGGLAQMLMLTLLLSLPWLFLFICNFIRGNHGPNKYGEDPKQTVY